MASIDRRIEDLERLYGMPVAEGDSAAEELEEKREALRVKLRLAEEKAAAEEAEGDSRRRRALDELYKWMERRED